MPAGTRMYTITTCEARLFSFPNSRARWTVLQNGHSGNRKVPNRSRGWTTSKFSLWMLPGSGCIVVARHEEHRADCNAGPPANSGSVDSSVICSM